MNVQILLQHCNEACWTVLNVAQRQGTINWHVPWKMAFRHHVIGLNMLNKFRKAYRFHRTGCPILLNIATE
jgi:hypothetical protein